MIAFIAPPMSAVFLIGVLWKRATARAALSSLIIGSGISLSVGVCHFKNWPNEQFWPHYLLVSFYLFVGIAAFMVFVSLLTRKSVSENGLPTASEVYATQGARSARVWGLWALLAAIMLSLYVVFD